MIPEQAIKREILIWANEEKEFDGGLPDVTKENVDNLYGELLIVPGHHWDYESEFRCSGEETEIECDYSRHYESKSVATELRDGTWAGWTYWYGGGNHGEPGSIDWMEDAYFLDVEEKEEIVVTSVFTKKGD